MSMALPDFIEELFHHPLYILPFLLFLIFAYDRYYLPTNNVAITSRNQPPSPPKLPIFGNLHQFRGLPHHSLQSFSQQYGELMYLQLGSKPTIVVSSANAARDIMTTHDVIFSNRPRLRIASKILYDGKDLAFSPYGEYWRQMKSICVLQLFSNKKVRSFQTIREEEAALMVEKIKGSCSSLVNLSEIIMTLTNDVVCRVAVGRKYSTGNKDGGLDFKELVKELVKLLGTFHIGYFLPWLNWIDRVNGLKGRAEKIAKDFDDFLEEVIQEHQDLLNSKNCNNDKPDKGENMKDFVDVLLEVQRENTNALGMDSIKALVLDMFVAGTETTYTLLEWAMTELLRHPGAMKEIQEVREIIKGKGGCQVTEYDLENMKYLKAVIKETIRLRPPLPLLLLREASQDVRINGYDIAARTLVIINAWAIQRDPASWKEPEEFRPGRFLNSSIDFKGKDFQFIPFGGGRRGCPGISFASVTAELVLANLVYEFDWTIPGRADCKTLDATEKAGISIGKRDPLMLIATPCS